MCHISHIAMTRRPRLVYSRPGMTATAVAEEASIEDAVRRAEAHRHVANLRLLARQLPMFEPDVFARLLLREADGYERKWADEPEAA